ncbi:ABC transporter G family member 19 [Fusarium oxysporum f. sp. albedinis]|nr:ABC transporter G family member 19 [Fusarium oxysporum f. sp. albedinis]
MSTANNSFSTSRDYTKFDSAQMRLPANKKKKALRAVFGSTNSRTKGRSEDQHLVRAIGHRQTTRPEDPLC